MATKIEWANETLNPFFGCTKVSPGCVECYAEKMAFRIGHIEQAALGDRPLRYCKVINFGTKQWNGNVDINELVLNKPFRWKQPRMIFVNSMSDTFHEKIPFEWIDKIIDVIRWTPQHTYLFLTKRPEIMLKYFTEHLPKKYTTEDDYVLPNLWLGVTAENQEMADKRIPILLQTPAAKRFVSVEPMLSHVIIHKDQIRRLHWVICGGMSGSNDYPVKVEWVATLQRQCKLTQTPFLFKQWGGLNKKRNGRLLGGVLYDEYPEQFDFHIIYTDHSGKVQDMNMKADLITQVEDHMKEIKAQYWEIGLPEKFR